LGGRHFESTRGYEYYRRLAGYIGKNGSDRVIDNFIDLQIWGTPDECYQRIVDIQSRGGHDGFNAVCSVTDMRREVAEATLRLFASERMPRVKDPQPIDPAELDAAVGAGAESAR